MPRTLDSILLYEGAIIMSCKILTIAEAVVVLKQYGLGAIALSVVFDRRSSNSDNGTNQFMVGYFPDAKPGFDTYACSVLKGEHAHQVERFNVYIKR